jgi:hypothetical protein
MYGQILDFEPMRVGDGMYCKVDIYSQGNNLSFGLRMTFSSVLFFARSISFLGLFDPSGCVGRHSAFPVLEQQVPVSSHLLCWLQSLPDSGSRMPFLYQRLSSHLHVHCGGNFARRKTVFSAT